MHTLTNKIHKSTSNFVWCCNMENDWGKEAIEEYLAEVTWKGYRLSSEEVAMRCGLKQLQRKLDTKGYHKTGGVDAVSGGNGRAARKKKAGRPKKTYRQYQWGILWRY